MNNILKAGFIAGLAVASAAATAGNYEGEYQSARFDGDTVLIDVGEQSKKDKPACHTNSRWDYKMTAADSDAAMRELVLKSPGWYMTIKGSGECAGNVETVKAVWMPMVM
jgi:hypothetical protein